MAATERLVGACARYAQRERESFREISRGWLRDRRSSSWEARVVKPGFPKFWLATLEDWTRLAADLLRRWRLPENRGEVDDMRQELAIGALKALRRYAPHHGVDLPAYVLWNALAYAKKRLHKMRGAKLSGNSGKNPSRIERPFSSLSAGGGEGNAEQQEESFLEAAMFSSGMVAEADHGERVEVEDRYAEVKLLCESTVEEMVVEVTFEGRGLDEATRRLYGDPDECLAYRIGGEEGARRVVGRAAHALAWWLTWYGEERVA